MPREPTEDELPAAYDELVAIERLDRDEYNVRNIAPPDDLVDSIKKTGFREALVVRKRGESYLITDGWERYQTALQLGYSHVPCDVYDNALNALREARRASIQTPWTQFQEMSHYVQFYDLCRDEGYSHEEALKKTVNEQDVSRRALKRHISIFDLPEPVLALLKEPDNRTDAEWEKMVRYDPNVRKSTSKLPVHVAATLSRNMEGVSIDRVMEAAINVLGVNSDVAEDIVIDACENPEEDIEEIIEKHLHNVTETEAAINISSMVVDKEVKKTLKKDSANRRVPLKAIVNEALEEKAEQIKNKSWFNQENASLEGAVDTE